MEVSLVDFITSEPNNSSVVVVLAYKTKIKFREENKKKKGKEYVHYVKLGQAKKRANTNLGDVTASQTRTACPLEC